MIKLEVIKNNIKYDISQLVTNVTWSGDYKSCSRMLEFTLISSDIDINIPKFDLPLSSLVIFYEDNKELFRGFVYTRDFSSDKNTVNYICFDYCAKLNDIKVSYNIKNKKPHEITNQIFGDYGIKKDNIINSTVSIKKLFIDCSIYDVIMSAYTEQFKKDGKKYMVYSNQDKVGVSQKGDITLNITFEQFKNITSASFKETLEGMVNKVIIVDDKGNKKTEVKDDNLIKLHGLFQNVYKIEEGKDATTEAKKMLNGVNQTCSLSGFGDNTCITGKGVIVKDLTTKLNGLFFIDSDTHTWENNKHSIDLELNFKNIMNEVEEGEDEDESSNKSSKNNSSNTSGKNDFSSSSKATKAVEFAKSKLGHSYVWGAMGPNTFDCSGLTSWCYKQVGLSIPRTSQEQSTFGKSVSKSNLAVGDLLFFSTNGTGNVSHVGIYAGGGNMIHAANPKKGVRVDSINSSYYSNAWKGARRVV